MGEPIFISTPDILSFEEFESRLLAQGVVVTKTTSENGNIERAIIDSESFYISERGYAKSYLQMGFRLNQHLQLNPNVFEWRVRQVPKAEKDWSNKRKFISGGSTPPSKSKRIKLRNKRKRK